MRSDKALDDRELLRREAMAGKGGDGAGACIIDSKEDEFQPDPFVDYYEEAAIIRKKKAHEPLKKSAERASAPKNVVNLMDALRRSVATEKPAGKQPKGKKRVAGQGEMLLPIAGTKGKDAAKETAKPVARRKAS